MHDHSHDDHAHDHGPAVSRRLTLALAITLGFALIEAATGWWSGSLALLSDAGHMLTDASALALAVLAAWIARWPADSQHTWGHGRAEVLAALANSLLLIGLVAGIVIGAVQRFHEPVAVNAVPATIVAVAGLFVNLGMLRLLSHGHQTLNTRAAMLHLVGDALASVAAITSGAVILVTGWTPIDPLLSLVICALILVSGARLLRESLRVVMEGVPQHLNLTEIGKAMARTPGVMGVHDLHIWTVRSDQIALSAHVVLRSLDDWMAILRALNESLAREYGIHHATLQPEPVAEVPLPHPKIRAR